LVLWPGKTADYTDCNYAASVMIRAVELGMKTGEGIKTGHYRY